MKEPTFSVITPTRDRDGRYGRGALERCMRSIAFQTYPKSLFEHVLIDDGNGKTLPDTGFGMYRSEGINYQLINHPHPLERYISYNDGMRAAKNDWLVFLDDDDEYVPFYLEYVANAIKANPQYSLFNYGGVITNKRDYWMRARDVVRFEQKVGCECESGMIVNGQFAFKKDCLKKSGYMPDTVSLWKAYEIADIPGYGDKPGDKPLGNPWGQDFFIFYKLTRHYISKPLDLYLYICHLRGSE